MKVLINKSVVKGTVKAPPSKSMTIRALMCAALARGTSEVVHPLVSDDTNAAAEVLGKIGVKIEKGNDVWRVTGGSLHASPGDLYCGESATTLRFMTAICSLIPGKHTLTGGPSLMKRPVKSLVEALNKLGVKYTLGGKTTPPVTIEGGTMRGSNTEIAGNVSSQYISALLLISPFVEKEMNITLTTAMTSTSYILMTIWCLKKFGIKVGRWGNRFVVRRQRYQPARIKIEGDWSSASYFLGLGAISPEGITVENIDAGTLQGDRVILEHIRRMGAVVKVGRNSITVSEGKLKGIQADLTDCIDLLPTVAVLASLADGITELSGIGHARIKESDRVAAVMDGLKKLDIKATEDKDRMMITGKKTPVKIEEGKAEEKPEEKIGEPEKEVEKGPHVISSYGDHRIAMAFSIFGAAEGGVTIEDAECVTKTYPEFWRSIKAVGGEIAGNG